MADDRPRFVPLHRLAHARSGDKGNRVNVGLFAYRPEDYPLLRSQVTVERVRELLAHRGCGAIARYELPQLFAFNFVIDDALEGGVNGSLNLDGHGKCLSSLVLTLPIDIGDRQDR